MGKFRRKAKAYYRKSKSYARRTMKGKTSASPLMMIGGAMAYGALREKASNALAPITAKVPLGNIADEVVLGGISYIGYKKTSGLVKEICKAGLIIESARVGEALINGQVMTTSSSASASNLLG